MNMDQLRYFVIAAECGSISKAARRCDITQPSLSQQISRLEADLNVTLLDRLARGVALTDAGRALYPKAKQLLVDIAHAANELRSDEWVSKARLVIGAIPTISPYVLPGLLAKMRKRWPLAQLQVREDVTEHLIEALVEGEIDVAILSTPIDHALIDVQVIASEPMLVVAPRKHPFGKLEVLGVDDLRDQDTITLDQMHCLGRQIGEFCAHRKIERRIVCQATQLLTVLELVRQGLGISIVPQMAADHVTGRGLIYLPMKKGSPTREIALAWHTGRTRPRLCRDMTNMLVDQLAGR